MENEQQQSTNGNATREVFKDYDADLQQFLTESEEQEIKARLSAVVSEKGRKKFAFIKEWSGYIPSFEEIADLVGPGSYRLAVWYMDKKGEMKYTTRNLHIDARYLEVKRKEQGFNSQPETPTVHAPQAQQPGMDPEKVFDVVFTRIERLFNAFMGSPMMSNYQNQNQSYNNTMVQVRKEMSNMIVDNYREQQGLINSFTQSQVNSAHQQVNQQQQQPQSEDERQPSFMDWVEFFKNMLEDWGPKLQKAGWLTRKAYVSSAQNSEQYQELVQNPELFTKSYWHLIDTKQVERPYLDNILQILGVQRPEQRPQQQQPATNGHGSNGHGNTNGPSQAIQH